MQHRTNYDLRSFPGCVQILESHGH